jgi:hypothetical protein
MDQRSVSPKKQCMGLGRKKAPGPEVKGDESLGI